MIFSTFRPVAACDSSCSSSTQEPAHLRTRLLQALLERRAQRQVLLGQQGVLDRVARQVAPERRHQVEEHVVGAARLRRILVTSELLMATNAEQSIRSFFELR